MSKRKRIPKSTDDSVQDPPQGEATDDASVKDDMVHVSPDLLAGSPDVFAPRKGAGRAASEPMASETPDAVTEPIVEESPTAPDPPPAATPEEPTDTFTTMTPEPEAPVSEAPPAAPPHVPYVSAVPHAVQPRRGGSSAALGVVLVVLGIFALGVVLFGVDLTQYGWPLFVIVPGLTLLVVGFIGLGAVASILGGIITMLGLVLAYQNFSGDWPTWAFAWSLVVPFGVGLGTYLQALRDRDQTALRRGRTLMFVGAMIFMIGFVFFESILGISGRDYGVFGKAALPILLIVIGLIFLVRSIQNSRRSA